MLNNFFPKIAPFMR